MKVIYGIGKVPRNLKSPVLVIGVFDGVHRGHRELICRALRKAREQGCGVWVMTFEPHPVHVLRPKEYLPYLVSLPHRLKLIESLGVTGCIVIRFTKGFSRLSPKEFIERYLVKRIAPVEVFVGDDFRFGQNRAGTLDYFRTAGKKYGFRLNVVDAVQGNHRKIGSSVIRRLISEGDLTRAAQLLGRRVTVMGKVRRGDGRGKTLGFPTANLFIDKEVIPPVGVYAVLVTVGPKIFKGMANVGRRPSFKKNAPVNIEAHLFHFDGDLYRKDIAVVFVRKIRNEQTFSSKAKLAAQLRHDRRKVLSILKHTK